METNETFSLADYHRVSPICEAAVHNSKVRRLIPDGENGEGLIVSGIARSIGDQNGNFTHAPEDVRDCYLRVTTDKGWEVFWSVRTLMDQVAESTFVVD